MSYALIDNASLTAVQRVMGDVIIENTDTINGDLVALENIIQAILFYDDLVCVDNYKQEHRKEREHQFNFIRFLDPNTFKFEDVERQASAEAGAICPEIRGGEFVNEDFKELLDLLKMNIVCTWDLSSSVYYLTMKMLGQPHTPEHQKYSELSAAIFNELSDVKDTQGRWSTDMVLYSSRGKKHTREEMQQEAKSGSRGLGGVTHSLEMFVASLNWLSYKTIYYSLLARRLQADTFLHPIRHAYQLHWMSKTGAYGHDFTAKLVQSLAGDVSTTVSEIVDAGRGAAISFDIPVFSAYIATQTGDVRNVIDAALEMKRASEFLEIRGMLGEIRNSFQEGGVKEANPSIRKWQSELRKASSQMKTQFGIETPQGIQMSKIISVYNTMASTTGWPQAPDIDLKLPWPDFLRRSQKNGFSSLYKDLTHELTSVERLGGVRDVLGACFKITKFPHSGSKTENPKYRRVATDWKIPM